MICSLKKQHNENTINMNRDNNELKIKLMQTDQKFSKKIVIIDYILEDLPTMVKDCVKSCDNSEKSVTQIYETSKDIQEKLINMNSNMVKRNQFDPWQEKIDKSCNLLYDSYHNM